MMKGFVIVGLLLLINLVAQSQSKANKVRFARTGGSGDRETRNRKDRLRFQQNLNNNNYNNNNNNNNNNNYYNSHLSSVHNPLPPQRHHTNTEDNHTEFVKGKICIGTKSKLSVPSNRDHHYRNLRDRYSNCTYVDGNLELTWLQDVNLDLSFLAEIREVTGYILVSHVDIERVVLPRLQIIRGRTLFKLNVLHAEEYSLFVTYSKMHSLELPALRDILDGSVGFHNNFNLCHVKTIDWKEIMSGQNNSYTHVYNFTVPERECVKCHDSCEGGCWGEGPENCQKFSKITCSPQCAGGRCFGQRPRECCHLFCAGGCTGPTQSDCIACKNFYDDGVCKQECPPMQKYNPTNYLWEPNPEGKYAYGATCVKNCPQHLLKDNGACVRTCPSNKTAQDGECVPCNGPCPKTCPGAQVLDSGNIDSFRGCTIIEGSLRILDQTFSGYQDVYKNYSLGPRYVRMHPDRLEVFSTVKEITGYLDIQGAVAGFQNLSYFRNLEVIHGRQLMENYFASFTVVMSSLESLELKSLKRINSGSVVIQQNSKMCFADGIAWIKIQKAQDPVVVIEKNRSPDECVKAGLVCSKECNGAGCWGAGPDQCLECKNFEYNGTCITDCKNITNAYKFNSKTCKTCDPECKSCIGPGPENCQECVHVRDDRMCLAACPIEKYSNLGTCKPCHETCEGCTGPDNTIRYGGCTTCDKAIIGVDNAIEKCLRKNESCPEGYYYEYVHPQESDFLKPLAGKAICRKCHPRCEKCNGYGFHEQVCQKCAGYKRGEQCEDECSPDHYADETKRECFECHSECKGCSGPGMDDCKSCRNFKVFLDGSEVIDNSTLFNCTEKCPVEYPFKNFDDIGSFCSAQPPRGSKLNAGADTQVVLISVFVILSCVLCALAFLAYSCRQNNKANEEAVKMTMVLSGCEDSEPLRPSNVGPNLTKLRIVKEAELRKGGVLGMGAFGRVFKGVWVPENENVKIPVAIKELLKVSGSESSKEFLEEAYIMASVEHPNLLKLLAVCMTSQMMLITQLMPLGCLLDYVRNNKDKIGSKALLNWSTQIARGMSYLEERRLVHRDLAARNVLVQTPSIVKITDFGLAKLLNNENEYKAAGGKMPIKWLALECIRHRVFTSKSDVWAFGVTIWELLSFGCRPHENIPAKDIPDLIEVGLKLEQPEICSLDIYCTLLSCWHLDAEMRPTFKQLVAIFAEFARDPGRYLVIAGDKFTRLPAYTSQDEKDLIRKLAPTFDGPEPIMETEDYLQPKQARPGPSHEIGEDGVPKIIRYCKDPMNTKGSPEDDETDSYAREVGVGNLRLDLPVDEDDYLMPTCQSNSNSSAPGLYMDLIGVPGSVDNPEYLMNSSHQIQQLPSSTASAIPSSSKHNNNNNNNINNNINNNNSSNNNNNNSSNNNNNNNNNIHNNNNNVIGHHQPSSSSLSSSEAPVPTQTLGIPVIINIPTPSTSSTSSNSNNSTNTNHITEGEQTSSDHEYYNDLQRELQPLHRSETTV